MRRIRNQRGVTFVEVMIGAATLLVAAGVLAGTTVTSMRNNAMSRDTAVAVGLANEWIEEVRAQEPWTLVDLEAAEEGPLDSLGRPDGDGRFMRSWTVTRNTPVKGTSLLRVTVSWGPDDRHDVEAAAFVCVTPTCS